MVRPTPFEIILAPEVHDHLESIEKKHHSLIASTITAQLSYEPEVKTRNRKPLRPPEPFAADWEIRFGPDNRFRVYYSVDARSRRVLVLAVGVKQGSRLFVGGEEHEL